MAQQKIGYFFYNTFLALAALIFSPIIIFRILVGFPSILASFKKKIGLFLKPVVWVHTASERQIPMVAYILQQLTPVFSGYQLVLTYTGRVAASAGKGIDPDLTPIALPCPVEFCSKRLISHLKPHLLLIVEGCFYPNLIRHCKSIGSKVALIDGRVDNRFPIVNRLAPNFLKGILKQIDLLMMSSVTEANRVGELGAPLSAIVVSDAVSYQETESKGEAELNEDNSLKQAIGTIGTLLGRNF